MLRLVISCLWICAVTLGSAYLVIVMKTHHAEAAANVEAEKIGYDKTRPINVPMISNGKVLGYVVAQFSYTTSVDDSKKANVPIEAFLLDEAFKSLFADTNLDFRHLEKYDITALTKGLIPKVNARLSSPMLKDVLVEEFNYVPKEEVSR